MSNEPSPSNYVVLRNFSAAGVDWAANMLFDASLVTPRLLRQLKEQRKIVDSTDAPKLPKAWRLLNRPVTKAPKYKPKNKPLKRPPPPDTAIRYKHIGHGKYAVIKGRHRVSTFDNKPDAEAFADQLRNERDSAREAAQ